MSSTPNDPTSPDYGASQPPPLPDQSGGQGGPGGNGGQASPIPPYEGAPPSAPHQPPPGQFPPGLIPPNQPPQDQPGYSAFPPMGDNVWQQPQYDRVPQWQANYGQGGFGQQMVTAPRLPRLGSYLIDLLILTIPSMLVFIPLSAMTAYTGDPYTGSATPGMGALLLIYVVLPALSYVYYGYFGGMQGATIGQRALGLKVVGDSTGEPIGFWWYVLRMLVLSITSSFCLLGYLSIFFDSSGKDRGWHDFAGRSRVIRAR